MRDKAQELIDLATGKSGEFEYRDTSSFSQEVTCISAKTDKTFVDENGELKSGYYNLRFKFTDKWESIYAIHLVYIETYVMDKYPGERATHNHVKIHNVDKIVDILQKDGYKVDFDRIF